MTLCINLKLKIEEMILVPEYRGEGNASIDLTYFPMWLDSQNVITEIQEDTKLKEAIERI